VLVVEACGKEIIWTEPRDLPLEETPVGINLPGEKPLTSAGLFSSYHRQGAHVLMADGSVRYLSDRTSPEVLEAILTADGGGPTPDF
jgi:prepilin-type processing-associated H-X9-DG protein